MSTTSGIEIGPVLVCTEKHRKVAPSFLNLTYFMKFLRNDTSTKISRMVMFV